MGQTRNEIPERWDLGLLEVNHGQCSGFSLTTPTLRFCLMMPESCTKMMLVLSTDAFRLEDPSFKEYAKRSGGDQNAIFKDYDEAHSKLGNLGAKFKRPEGLSLDDSAPGGQPEKN